MRILVIDDDPSMTELLRLVLQPAMAEVVTANSGPEGVRLAQTLDPDVITLDLMMPDMNGWQVCKAVREISQVPILILSALDSPGLVAAALDAGADDYLIKPVTSSVLLAHINKLVRRNNRPSQGLTAFAAVGK
jgi:two-component system, OmpR family, KDP operon response regulator KdpE